MIEIENKRYKVSLTDKNITCACYKILIIIIVIITYTFIKKLHKNIYKIPIYKPVKPIESLKLSLKERMKSLEIESRQIQPYESFIIRADGKSFSSYTKGLKEPFDTNFINAIVHTSNSLLSEFNGATISYCCSDEISIIVPRICSIEEYNNLVALNKQLPTHYAGGRQSKIITLVAARCSVIFNKYINEEIKNNLNEYTEKTINKIRKSEAIFDARIVIIPIDSEIELVNNIIWRSNYDCLTNTISTYGRYKLGNKLIQNKNGAEQIQMMKDNNFDFNTVVPNYIKYGILSKKILINIIDESGDKYIRSKIMNFSSNIMIENKIDVLKLFLSKYYINDLINIVEYL